MFRKRLPRRRAIDEVWTKVGVRPWLTLYFVSSLPGGEIRSRIRFRIGVIRAILWQALTPRMIMECPGQRPTLQAASPGAAHSFARACCKSPFWPSLSETLSNLGCFSRVSDKVSEKVFKPRLSQQALARLALIIFFSICVFVLC